MRSLIRYVIQMSLVFASMFAAMTGKAEIRPADAETRHDSPDFGAPYWQRDKGCQPAQRPFQYSA